MKNRFFVLLDCIGLFIICFLHTKDTCAKVGMCVYVGWRVFRRRIKNVLNTDARYATRSQRTRGPQGRAANAHTTKDKQANCATAENAGSNDETQTEHKQTNQQTVPQQGMKESMQKHKQTARKK